jgi:general secretion pathway protein K
MKSVHSRGVALLLVMWAMFIMSFAILGLIGLLNITIGTASTMERVAMASSLAFAGATMGRNPDFPADGLAERQKFPDGGNLEVIVVSENSKFHINRMLESNDRDTLRALFRIWGLNDVEADTVLDCLFDYVEPGTTRRLNGAKAEQYRRAGRPAPPGRPFRSIEEMASVLNFDLVARRKENWREYFTVYGNGTLDLTTAPADLIKALCRVGDSSAKGILNARAKEGPGLPDLDSARSVMGLTEKEFNALDGRLAIGGSVRRVRSEGRIAQARRTIEAIYQLEGGEAKILEWKEW